MLKNYTETKEERLEAMIDTGYDGNILIPRYIYDKLGLFQFEFPEDQKALVETASGEIISLTMANAIIELPDIEFKLIVTVDTFDTAAEVLVGRQFLEVFIATLNGIDQTLTLSMDDD
ncbi:MAG: hypothetical protein INQ03_14405 [Candidatus Heimdallarchaeota archaeon]|nr:hypothetical protein [Candidatus Heimdallarchaeota archaeon]